MHCPSAATQTQKMFNVITYTFLPLVNPPVVLGRMNCRDYVV